MSFRLAIITDLHWRRRIPGSSPAPARQSRLMPKALEDALALLRRERTELLLLCGDLADMPEKGGPGTDEQILENYRDIRVLLDNSEIPWLAVPGNHDRPDLFSRVFGLREELSASSLQFVAFHDLQEGADTFAREGRQLERFFARLSEPGPRNQVFVQHYLVRPRLNDRFPHSYENCDELAYRMEKSGRVLLCVSGHYHRGAELSLHNGTWYYTAEAFCETPFPVHLLELDGSSVQAKKLPLALACGGELLENPYRKRRGRWLRGNLHSHCLEASACSEMPRERLLAKYAGGGYDFLTLSDHDAVLEDSGSGESGDLGLNGAKGMILIPGFEYSFSAHALIIGNGAEKLCGMRDFGEVLAAAAAGGLLSIACHPEGPRRGYWTEDGLLALKGLDGMEIFNGHYGDAGRRWAPQGTGAGSQYTRLWDEVLSRGARLFGFANDDMHLPLDFAMGANFALAGTRSQAAILAALKSGAFFASTGLLIKSVQEYRGRVIVCCAEDCEGLFIGPGGERLSRASGELFEYGWTGEAYLRFEADINGRKCWAQPMFSLGGAEKAAAATKI